MLFPVSHNLEQTVAGFEDERTIYNIPEANYPRFEKEIAKLSKRSVRLIGYPILPVPIGYDVVKNAMGIESKIIQVYLQADSPKLAGWTFVARLDHSNETGNVIRIVPNIDVTIPDHFRTCAPNCEHCGVRRKRRDTFVIRNDETGAFQQVGSTCLADFFGHDPYKIARLAEYLGYANEAARGNEEYDELAEQALHNRRSINLDEYLCFAAKAVLKHGWVSAGAARESEESYALNRPVLVSTRSRTDSLRVESRYDSSLNEVTAEERALVDGAIEWAQTVAEDPKSDYEHNIAVIANSLYIEPRSCGLAASIVGVYYNKQRKAAGVVATPVGDMSGLITFLKNATVKRPKLRLTFDHGRPLAVSIGKAGSKWAGFIFLDDGENFDNKTNYGMIKPSGEFVPSRALTPSAMEALVKVLAAMANNPEQAAAQFGKLTGSCCFCNQPLSNPRSLEVGYGETCASSFNLPWGRK